MSASIKPFPHSETRPSGLPQLITLKEFATLWSVPITWLHHHCRSTCDDPLPVYRLGRYVRVDLNDPSLTAWLKRRHVGGQNA